MAIRDQGLVNQVFDEHKLRSLVGDMAIGHVRYSTTGSSEWENAQPIVRDDRRTLALAHNGNLINAVELHAELRGRDVPFRSTSDSEIIAALLATHPAERIEDAVADVLPRLQGRVLDRGDDRGRGRRLPRSPRPAPARARHDRGPGRRAAGVLRRQRVMRVRPDRRQAPARRDARRGGDAHRARDQDPARRRRRAPRVLRVRVHLLRPPGLADGRHRPAGGPRRGWGRSCGARRRSRPTS